MQSPNEIIDAWGKDLDQIHGQKRNSLGTRKDFKFDRQLVDKVSRYSARLDIAMESASIVESKPKGQHAEEEKASGRGQSG